MHPPPEDGASASTGAMPCPPPGEEASLHNSHQPPGPPRHECALVGSTRRWCRKMAHTPAPPSHSEPFTQLVLTHIHQLLVGNPCPCWRSTKLSLLHSSLPSNWQIQHRNRMVQRTSHIHHPDWGSPCRGLCSTTPSWPQTSLLANSRNHRHNCRGLPGPVAVSAGHRCGASCSTNPS